MILPPALLLGAHLLVPVAADNVPTLNVEQVCQGIAQQGGVSFHDADVAEEKQNCLESEKAIREEIVKEWPTFSATDKNACTNEATMGGDSSYTELLTCLEMARDVRAMRDEQSAKSAAQAKPAVNPASPKPAPKISTKPML